MSRPDFGIYVHWPYCARICPYCDFNVYRDRADRDALLGAIETDLAAHAARFGRRRAVSLFLGGGTPSLLRGDEVARLINAARKHFDLAADAEITLEANPEDYQRFEEHVAAGVSRLSIGVQALDDVPLKALGRNHDAATARKAVETAARTGARISLDLIYAREGQTVVEWTSELRDALTMPIEHVSLYQLTIEQGTAFERQVSRGALVPPDADASAELYETTQDLCDTAGFAAYEISNHSRGANARSRHNMLYWRAQDWIGVGPGAHGRITHEGKRFATEAHRAPQKYVDAIRTLGIGVRSEHVLSSSEIADEILVMGLRIDEGVDVKLIEDARQHALDKSILARLEFENLVQQCDGRIRLTSRGRLLANAIAAELST